MIQHISSRNHIAIQRAYSLLVLIVLLQVLARLAESMEINQPQVAYNGIGDNSNSQDLIVWDESSLYKQANKFGSSDRLSTTRRKRSTTTTNQQLVDACQSKMEILTPYYATNSKGKLRTIVNSELMQQAIQVETCVRSPTTIQRTAKCSAQLDCGCEQKYKWHRLLVLDPRGSGASQGLFMDWFLFPSSCVCRCKSAQWTSKQFLRIIKKSAET